MREGALVEVAVESLAAGGDGVAHLPDGRVLFVPFAAPGDRLRVRLERVHARRAHGRIDALLEPGPGRVEPPCPVFGRCGGCTWQHLDEATQRDARRGILRDALQRIGGIELPEALELVPSPAYGYRVRARLVVEGGGLAYRERGSHRACAIEGCPVLAPALERALLGGAAPDPGDASGVEIKALLGAGDAVQRCPVDADGRPAPGVGPVDLETPCGALRVSPGVFAQANGPLRGRLVELVVELAGDAPVGLAVELFAGAGLFSVALARRAGRLIAVESSPDAVADLVANARRHELEHLEPVRAEALAWLRDPMPPLPRAPDLVVLDPPRTGLGERGSGLLARLGAARIVYVACDPVTLARDLRVLCARGYSLEGVVGLDCFPQTPHLEAIAWLGQGAARGPGPRARGPSAAPC